jgi:ribosomal protein L6P/L9E
MSYNIKMKNILKSRIQVSSSIQFFLEKNALVIKGPETVMTLVNINFLKTNKPLFYRLLQKAIIGVSFGFVKQLSFVGVGYRVESISENSISLKLGYSHLVSIKVPPSIKVFSPKRTLLILKSCDLQFLNEFIAFIRSKKLPDVYKGKGILFRKELILLKDGKKK